MSEIRQKGGDPGAADYMAVDYGLTSMLIKAAAGCGGNPRFVYLSAMGVGPNARGEYYRARYKAESELIESGLPYTIIRPAFITGPDRDEFRPGEKFVAGLLDAGLTVAGAFGGRKLKRRLKSIDAKSLAEAIVRHAIDPEAQNKILGPEHLR